MNRVRFILARRATGAGFATCATLVSLVVASCGSGGPHADTASGRISTESPAMFRAAISARMRAQHLDYQWVACVPSGRTFDGVRVVRCNVDFGIDPHVEAYCSVLRDGQLLTSEDDAAIPCGADNAGYTATLTTFR